MSAPEQKRFLRLHQIIGRPARDGLPGITPLIPVGKTTWWAGVRDGRFPAPVRGLGKRISAWRSEDVFALIDRANAGRENG